MSNQGEIDSVRAGLTPVRVGLKPVRTIVIGYGNTLRGDDALGPVVAHAVGSWEIPEVKSVVVHQLTPELAETLSTYDVAIFVDAQKVAMSEHGCEVGVEALEPVSTPATQTHVVSPGSLLALARVLYGRQPRAWLVTIGAFTFEMGAPLSHTAKRGRDEAFTIIHQIITNERR